MRNNSNFGDVLIIRHFSHSNGTRIFSKVKNVGTFPILKESELISFFEEMTAYSIEDSEIEIGKDSYACTDINNERVIYWAELIPDDTSYTKQYKVTFFVSLD